MLALSLPTSSTGAARRGGSCRAMKRALLGTGLLLATLIVTLLVATRWPALFWLTTLALLLYLAFGRRVEVEFRLGVGDVSGEGRVYLALAWKRQKAAAAGQPASQA